MAIRRRVTCLDPAPDKLKNADTCADYLLAKKEYLCYEGAFG
ncbi:MAG: hypothetical protein ACYCV7_07935 [Acidimicrobiales bacterium]